MSESKPSNNRQFLAQLKRLGGSGRSGIVGPAELAGLSASLVLLLIVIVSYLYFLVPARSRVEALQQERSRLQTQLRDSEEVIRQGQDTKTIVDSISSSLEEFETSRLVGRSEGRMGLYDELNELIRKNGLRNTSGPTYTSLDPAGMKTGRVASVRSASTKWQSVYPGIGVSVTVDGQYQNLRQFLRAIESSRQFIVINAVELERATESGSSAALEDAPTGGHRPTLVSLRLDMAIYFQRGAGSEVLDSTER